MATKRAKVRYTGSGTAILGWYMSLSYKVEAGFAFPTGLER